MRGGPHGGAVPQSGRLRGAAQRAGARMEQRPATDRRGRRVPRPPLPTAGPPSAGMPVHFESSMHSGARGDAAASGGAPKSHHFIATSGTAGLAPGSTHSQESQLLRLLLSSSMECIPASTGSRPILGPRPLCLPWVALSERFCDRVNTIGRQAPGTAAATRGPSRARMMVTRRPRAAPDEGLGDIKPRPPRPGG